MKNLLAFSTTRDVAYAMLANRAAIVAVDLATGQELWRVVPAFVANEGATVANLTSDEATLVVADDERVFFIDTKDGSIRATANVGSDYLVDLEMLPGDRATVDYVAIEATTF